jgi:hypothetical protein
MVQIYRTSFHYMARRMMPCTFLNVFNFTLFWIFNFSCFDCEPHFISDSDNFFRLCVVAVVALLSIPCSSEAKFISQSHLFFCYFLL